MKRISHEVIADAVKEIKRRFNYNPKNSIQELDSPNTLVKLKLFDPPPEGIFMVQEPNGRTSAINSCPEVFTFITAYHAIQLLSTLTYHILILTDEPDKFLTIQIVERR